MLILYFFFVNFCFLFDFSILYSIHRLLFLSVFRFIAFTASHVSSFECTRFKVQSLPISSGLSSQAVLIVPNSSSGFRLLASGKMSSRVFSIIGDRNVLDNMTSYNTASREVMQSAQIINCPALSELANAFLEIRLVSFSQSLAFNFNFKPCSMIVSIFEATREKYCFLDPCV